jgi:hypothetical protein
VTHQCSTRSPRFPSIPPAIIPTNSHAHRRWGTGSLCALPTICSRATTASTAATVASTFLESRGRFSHRPRIMASLRTCQRAILPVTISRNSPTGRVRATASFPSQSASATARAIASAGRQPWSGSSSLLRRPGASRSAARRSPRSRRTMLLGRPGILPTVLRVSAFTRRVAAARPPGGSRCGPCRGDADGWGGGASRQRRGSQAKRRDTMRGPASHGGAGDRRR